MTISQLTTVQAYQLNKGGVRARMAILRMVAADSANNRNEATRLLPGDWKKARSYTLNNYASAYAMLSSGLNDGSPIWYTHGDEQFRDERDADDVVRLRHRGWFTDGEDCSETAVGIVARLSHGRFVAGYRLTMNDERVYFPCVFTDETEAAHAADEHARVIAERESEHATKFQEAQRIESDIDDALQHVRRIGQPR